MPRAATKKAAKPRAAAGRRGGNSRAAATGGPRRRVPSPRTPSPKPRVAAGPRLSRTRVTKPRTAAERKARVAEILRRLDEAYPAAQCALGHDNAWQLLVATILSAQCTDKRVNMVTPGLFQKYPAIEDFAAVRQEVLEQDIRSTGFYRNKTKSLIGAARAILAEFGGRVPETMEEMLRLPGVARKTANVVLGTAFGKATGVVVDTHVQRIAFRLDLTKQTDPKKIEQDLMEAIPQNRWILFSHQIIHHGRQICYARKPACARCNLEAVCYSKDKNV
jgi:endonuclease-3